MFSTWNIQRVAIQPMAPTVLTKPAKFSHEFPPAPQDKSQDVAPATNGKTTDGARKISDITRRRTSFTAENPT
jgi:hypothetical protein